MYEVSIQRVFSAAHAICVRGEREALHGHDWRVTVVVAGDSLDADGLLCDFHDLERIVETIIGPFHNANLNETPPFDSLNPTAERIAEHLGRRIVEEAPASVQVRRVSVTEAPGCEASYCP